MPAALSTRGPWKLDTPNQRLAVALVVSLVVHALGYVSWHVAPAVRRIARDAVVRVQPPPSRDSAPQVKQAPPPVPETAIVFVEVDPALSSAEPPKQTKNYSTHNSVAANAAEQPKADVPKIDGSQTKVLRMADNPKPAPQPLQPSAPQPQQRPERVTEADSIKPKPAQPIGDLALVKPEPTVKPDTGTGAEPKPQRPRTLREVVQRNPALAGQKTLQDGGVPRRARVAMVDAKASPFGEYDYAFVRAVEQRWFQLLDDNQYLLDRQGKVTVVFRLHHNGRISDVSIADSTVGEILSLLCQKAILDPAPFPPWPTAMRQAVREDYRDVRFTFYYD